MDQIKKELKVCVIVDSLGKGGAERSSAILSRLFDESGYDVTIISILNVIDYKYKGKLICVDNEIKNGGGFIKKIRKLLYLRSVLNQERFDYIIDSRARPTFVKEYLVSLILYKKEKVVYIIRSGNISLYLSKYTKLAGIIYNKAFCLVGVSQRIVNEIKQEYRFNNVSVIYNSFYEEDYVVNDRNEYIENKEKYILAYGRIDEKVKNFCFLIEAYVQSVLPKKKIKLMILGEGDDLDLLKEKVKSHNMENNILFKGYSAKPYALVKKALFTTLTSKYEGFPRVILESLAIGVPVVSVDCISGPSEMIINRVNGLLVKQNDLELFTEALNEMILNKELYSTCKQKAKKSVHKFSHTIIKKEWNNLLQGE